MRDFNKHEPSDLEPVDRNTSGFFSMILVSLGLRLLSAIIGGILVVLFILVILLWYNLSSVNTITLIAQILQTSIVFELAAGILRLVEFVFLNGDTHRRQISRMSWSLGLQVGILLGIGGTVGTAFSSFLAATSIGRANNLGRTSVGVILIGGLLIAWIVRTIKDRLLERFGSDVTAEMETDQPSEDKDVTKDIS